MLDTKDKKIIETIDYNSRVSLNEISKKTNLKKDTINFRIKKLEKDKIITLYYCVIDYYKLGFSSYKIYLKVKSSSKQKIINYFIKILDVKFISELLFEYDLCIFFNSKSQINFYKMYNDFLEIFSQDILKKEFFEVLEQYHFSHPLYKNSKKFKIEKQKDILKIDETQKQILQNLSLNANMKFIELSIKLNKNSSTLIYSFRNLLDKKIIIGTRPRINYSKLNKIHFIVLISLSSGLNSVLDYITTLENVIYISKGFSSFDFEFEVVLNSQKDLNKFLESLTNKFENINFDFKILQVLKSNVINY